MVDDRLAAACIRSLPVLTGLTGLAHRRSGAAPF
jgi:hypothetical protein